MSPVAEEMDSVLEGAEEEMEVLLEDSAEELEVLELDASELVLEASELVLEASEVLEAAEEDSVLDSVLEAVLEAAEEDSVEDWVLEPPEVLLPIAPAASLCSLWYFLTKSPHLRFTSVCFLLAKPTCFLSMSKTA